MNQLWLLHYDQEKSFAELIKKAPPFSAERAILMKNGYETVSKIIILRNGKKEEETTAFGAVDSYIKIIEKIVEKIVLQEGKCLFFEAGIGTGKIINRIAELQNVVVMGCDVCLDKKLVNSALNVYECTIYEALLKLDNNSIDVFYWNDVMEHIPEDEIEEYIKLLSEKMSIGGIIITITPNRLKGPGDITCHFEPHGTIAKGFHFHEYTFNEILTLFQKYNIKSAYGFLGYASKGWYLLGSAKIIDRIKLSGEKIIVNLPFIIRKILLGAMGCEVSLLKKIQ